MDRIRLVYIISDIRRSAVFEATFALLDQKIFDLHFILLNSDKTAFEQIIRSLGAEVYPIHVSSKKAYPKAVRQIYCILRRLQPQIVHTHMRTADFLGLSAAWLAGVKVRVHTRHFSTNNHEYYRHAVKYDRLINTLATHIVAISDNIRNVLIEKEHVKPEKINVLYNAHDLAAFSNVSADRVAALRQKYAIDSRKFPIIGCIGRYITLKGHKYVIEAFAQLLKIFPNAYLILANASGSEKNIIQTQLKQQLPPDSYTEIVFEEQIQALYSIFDLFTHVPINEKVEGFGLTYIEALAAGVPSVFTLSGVANEFVKDSQNALCVPYCDAGAIERAWLLLLRDKDLREKLKLEGQNSVAMFDVRKKTDDLMQYYCKITHS